MWARSGTRQRSIATFRGRFPPTACCRATIGCCCSRRRPSCQSSSRSRPTASAASSISNSTSRPPPLQGRPPPSTAQRPCTSGCSTGLWPRDGLREKIRTSWRRPLWTTQARGRGWCSART
eukprot:Amastigsp_a2847_8.p3 type:complete len:121 gc:universal Amastigsp_a2847_8:512-150(-)